MNYDRQTTDIPKTAGIESRLLLFSLLVFAPLVRGGVQPWAVTVIEIGVLAATAALLVRSSLAWDWQWLRTPLNRPLAALLALSGLAALWSMHRGLSLWAVLLLTTYLAVFYLAGAIARDRRQLLQLVGVIIGVAVFLAFFGLVKAAGSNPFPWWEYRELSYPRAMLAATFGNHNHLAGSLEMAIPLLLGLCLAGLRRFWLAVLLLLAALLATAWLLSLSRGGWIGLLAGLGFMGLALAEKQKVKGRRLLAIIAALAVVSAVVLIGSTPAVERLLTAETGTDDGSLQSRLVVWQAVLAMLRDHPLLGTGPGTFATVFTQYQPPGMLVRFFQAHNDYLHFLAETGIAMAAVIAWLVAAVFRKGMARLYSPSRLQSGIALGAMGGLVAILVHSVFDFNLHIPANALLFTVLAALAAGGKQQTGEP